MAQRPISETFAQAAATAMSPGGGTSPPSSSSSSSSANPSSSLKEGSSSKNNSSSSSSSTDPSSSSSDSKQRPASEAQVQPGNYQSPESEAIDRWADDLAAHQETMEAMAKASLDQNFKDELGAIEQWFQVLSDAERTATLYALLQHSNRVQQGFFIAYLQQLARKDHQRAKASSSSVMGIASAGRARRLSSKPALSLEGTNEKYARMLNEEASPAAAAAAAAAAVATANGRQSPVRSAAAAVAAAASGRTPTTPTTSGRPKSAATPSGLFPMSSDRWSTPTGLSPPGLTTSASVSAPRPLSTADAATAAVLAAAAEANPSTSATTSYGSKTTSVPSTGANGPPQGSKWSPMTPTFSTFSEMAKSIERPRSAHDTQKHAAALNGGAGPAGGPTRAPMGPADGSSGAAASPGPGSAERTFMGRPLSSARTPTGRFPTTGSSSKNGGGGNSSAASSPAFPPPGLQFPSNPWASSAAPTTPGVSPAASLDKKAAALKQKYAGLMSDGRLMDPTIGKDVILQRLMGNGNHGHGSSSSGSTPTAPGFAHSSSVGTNHYSHLHPGSPAGMHGSASMDGKGLSSSSSTTTPNSPSTPKAPKPQEPIDFEILKDVPAWFRSMRLHKYTSLFESMTWKQIIKLDEDALSSKGVAALGARRKMLKTFDQVKREAVTNSIPLD